MLNGKMVRKVKDYVFLAGHTTVFCSSLLFFTFYPKNYIKLSAAVLRIYNLQHLNSLISDLVKYVDPLFKKYFLINAG
jgi:hypothetical protein